MDACNRCSTFLLALLTISGCLPPVIGTNPAPSAPGMNNAPAAAVQELPGELLTTHGSSPAIFTGSESQAPAVGYITGGVRVQISGPAVGDRAPVRIDGPMAIRGWISISRLGMRVIHRGRVRETPTYLGPGDLVRLLGSDDEGNIRIEIRPRLSSGAELGPFEGVFPGSGLSLDEPPADAEAPREGTPASLPAAQAVQIYDRPDGSVVATIPAATPPEVVVVLRDRGDWKGVRVGVGPYIVGYINVPLGPADAAPSAPATPSTPAGGMPARIASEQNHPLFSVPDRARVRFDGRTFAILHQPGFAREMQRYENTQESDVFVAVNDQVAVRGLMRISDLTPAPADAQAPAATPAP
ncbi:MAG: hypothetical protein GXP55_12705 [Deltaproteobacteria bacterium]|nr:hypothetical protein [Deltaproteobacteria bacterium]